MATTVTPSAKQTKKTKRARGSEKSVSDAVRHRKKNTPVVKELAPSELKELCRQCKIGRAGGKELRRRVTGTLELFLQTMNKGVDLYAYSRGRSTATSQDVDRAYKHYYGRRLYGLGDEAEFRSPSKRRKVSNKSRGASAVNTKEPEAEDAEAAAEAEPAQPAGEATEVEKASSSEEGDAAASEQEVAEAGEEEEAADAAEAGEEEEEDAAEAASSSSSSEPEIGA